MARFIHFHPGDVLPDHPRRGPGLVFLSAVFLSAHRAITQSPLEAIYWARKSLPATLASTEAFLLTRGSFQSDGARKDVVFEMNVLVQILLELMQAGIERAEGGTGVSRWSIVLAQLADLSNQVPSNVMIFELKQHKDALSPILEAAHKGTVTLLYSSLDQEHKEAAVLREFLQHTLKPKEPGVMSLLAATQLEDPNKQRRV